MTEYIYSILKKYFGYSTFKEGQEEIVKEILSGKDVLAVMPTGAGKSMCYQVPALAFSGITIVISPLISLMKDQVTALNQMGIRAAYLNSTLSYNQYLKALSNASNGVYKIIYVAPERLSTDIFREFAQNANISLIAVDEAHCISSWGQDFRPSYLYIDEFIKSLKQRPIITAFTATATKSVKEDIKDKLNLKLPYEITTSFDRKNLYFAVEKPEKKERALLQKIAEYKNVCGIIYCASRKQTEKTTEILNENGYSASCYHAGLSNEDRTKAQDDFTYDRVKIIVATSAFGMGIDKSNVRFVIHYNMPIDIESYYQEAGRAGRDGAPADCILLYSGADVRLGKFMIDKGLEEKTDIEPEEVEALRERAYKRLKDMTFYATSTSCLRKKLLAYFGDSIEKCHNCSACNGVDSAKEISVEAVAFLKVVERVSERYGLSMICDILTGEFNPRAEDKGFDRFPEYGKLSGTERKSITKIFNWLIENEYIMVEKGQYPTISLLAKGKESLSESGVGNFIKLKKNTQIKSAVNRISSVDVALLEKLKILRKQLADKQSVPAYVIFTDAVLTDMAANKPANLTELLKIKGIGENKANKYGEIFIKAINNH